VKKSVEVFQVRQLLRRLEELGYQEPSVIAASEKPDFVLTTAAGHVGVEVTAAVYSEYVRARRIHREMLPDRCIDTTHLKDREPRRSKGKLLEEIASIGNEWPELGQGMCDWRDKISLAVNRKRMKLKAQEYQKFDQNWLFIYDDPGLANDVVTRDLALEHLLSMFSALAPQVPDFHAFFVLSDRYLFRWDSQKLSFHCDNRHA
jgi:hypothetical protein